MRTSHPIAFRKHPRSLLTGYNRVWAQDTIQPIRSKVTIVHATNADDELSGSKLCMAPNPWCNQFPLNSRSAGYWGVRLLLLMWFWPDWVPYFQMLALGRIAKNGPFLQFEGLRLCLHLHHRDTAKLYRLLKLYESRDTMYRPCLLSFVKALRSSLMYVNTENRHMAVNIGVVSILWAKMRKLGQHQPSRRRRS